VGFIDFPGFAFSLVIAAVILDHGIGTIGAGIMTAPGDGSLVQAERQVGDAVDDRILPVEVLEILADDVDNFPQSCQETVSRSTSSAIAAIQIFAGNGEDCAVGLYVQFSPMLSSVSFWSW